MINPADVSEGAAGGVVSVEDVVQLKTALLSLATERDALRRQLSIVHDSPQIATPSVHSFGNSYGEEQRLRRKLQQEASEKQEVEELASVLAKEVQRLREVSSLPLFLKASFTKNDPQLHRL